MADTDTTFTVLDIDEAECVFEESNPLNQALELWELWSQDRPAPTWKNVELYSLPPVLLPQTLVVDVVDDGKDFRYRFWGTEYTQHYGCDETGLLLSESLGPNFIKATQAQLKRVYIEKKPLRFEVTILAPKTGVIQSKTNLRLPIMDTIDTVTKIMTVSLFHPTSHEQIETLQNAFDEDKQHR